ncbi:uncharacterized protein LOC131881124 isoform X2 [Tigriopus californicus]|uniref:uncharacterized protein LOC131881124 isoform X1 n=1 Tax=Tigriopus californicus TaxID=6832 RepID=UPI0027D9EA5D|nr:uncharacterized protein LOC131881124 isoform X1 [Tigriopus californicus]XP_059083878.1 uncharacterized protein LOC131881124 isoform X2 [Tigriopus californicus]
MHSISSSIKGIAHGLCPISLPESATTLARPLKSQRDLYMEASPISFTLNKQNVIVDTSQVSSTTSLARFIRDHMNLKGTKISCNQAGCGACVVKVAFKDPFTQTTKTRSVNSCITPVFKCEGWDISTVEALGSTHDGLSEVQKRLAKLNGTQCGFCTPGMVMAMDSYIEEHPNATKDNMKGILDGNICRCTGYRPIFDTFQSFASDASTKFGDGIDDIEDMVTKSGLRKCPKTNSPCRGECFSIPRPEGSLQFIQSETGHWIKPDTLEDLLAVLDDFQPDETYRLVAGNTGTGIYNDGPYSTFVDITGIPELVAVTMDSFNVGGSVALTDFIDVLKTQFGRSKSFNYTLQIAKHLEKVANTNVRNVGSLAGNLMLKHAHPEFPSDLFTLLEGVGAHIGVKATDGSTMLYAPSDWLSLDMAKKIIFFIQMPVLADNEVFMSYKITPRSQNAHAYVNAAFRAKIDPNSFVVQDKPNIVYGGIAGDFIHATDAESVLVGKSINDQTTLDTVFASLDSQVVPDDDPVLSSAEYRIHLSKALFFKFVIHTLGAAAKPNLKSAATQISRGVSSGAQDFTPNQEEFPIGEPIEKLEAKVQCTGEAEYVDDIPAIPGELFAAYVQSTIGNCNLKTVDPGPALAMPDVVAYVDHTDIPGMNSTDGHAEIDVIFASSKVSYAGQAIGLIVATSLEAARAAAKKVVITYQNQQKPILTIKEAIKTRGRQIVQSTKTIGSQNQRNQKGKLTEINGEFEIGGQYHFHMELQSCIVRPIENGEFDIMSTTQAMDVVQFTVAQALGITKNKVNVTVRRLGGAYGGKITLPNAIATACAVAAEKVRKPVRLTLDLQSNMELLGKRSPYLFEYSASVDESNKLVDVTSNIYADVGFSGLAPDAMFVPPWFQNCYNSTKWTCNPFEIQTNLPTNTACRAPSSTQGIAAIEYIMDHVATSLGVDPMEFRMNNLLKPGDHILSDETATFQGPNRIPDMVSKLKQECDFETRRSQILAFNQANTWKKRALRITPMRWAQLYFGYKYKFQAAIFKDDGTVAISHGGIEMGQGLNTKVVQVAAKELGVPVNMIRVKPSNTFVGNNSIVTGGSLGSELVASAAFFACKKLRAEMKKVEDGMSGTPTWLELVSACDLAGLDLTARHSSWQETDNLKGYDIWGATCTEIELDLLTGEKTVRRADVMEDTGAALSPNVDIGQVEGAFVMGLGLWLTEELKYEATSGRLLTRDSWEYKPPASQDIPEVFNTYLYNSQDNPYGVLGSKATGEPPLLMAVSSFLALKDAMKEGRYEMGQDGWFSFNGPATNENITKTMGLSSDYFKL